MRRGYDRGGTYAGGSPCAQSNYSQHRWDATEATDTGKHPYLQIDVALSSTTVLANSKIGVFRPSNHMFYLKNGTTTAINWGISTDKPGIGKW